MGLRHCNHLQDNMKFLVVCSLVAYCLLLPCAAQNNAADQGLVEIKQQNQARLFGGYSTRTRLSTLTSTFLYTCASVLQVTAVCQGKRKKRTAVMENLMPPNVENEELSSSHNIQERSAEEREKGKLFIALTTFTTLTTTEQFVNSATTVSISYSCLPLGDTIPPLCG